MSSSSYSNTHLDRIVAFFARREDAYRAISALQDAGYTNSDIGLISQDDLDTYETEPVSAASSTPSHGASFWEKVKDFFRGESHDDYDYQNHYAGATSDLGWTNDRAEYYRHGIGSGGALVTVSGTRSSGARAILEENGGDLRESGFNVSSLGTGTAEDLSRRDYEGRRIQLRGERLRTFKDRVQRGEVRLRKEVVTEKQNIEVPVTREELVIERTQPTDRRTTGDIGADDEIRVPISEERVRVEKEPVVTEEVRVGKRAVQRAERVSDDVRHEELRVDKEGDVDVAEGKKPIRKDPAA